MKVLTCKQMKTAEKSAEAYGLSGLTLMENAGAMASRVIRESVNVNRDKVVVLVGKGNNGGDGYVVARKLVEAGANVQVVTLSSPATESAAEMRDKAIAVGIRPVSFEIYPELSEKAVTGADVIVDAIFGTGFSGELEGIYRAVIDLVNKQASKKIALDVPSGINGDTGEVKLCVNADVTIVFECLKLCHILYPSNGYCGKIKVVPIGINKNTIASIKGVLDTVEESEIVEKLPKRPINFHKGDAGKAVLLCGSVGFSGAAVIAAKAAVRSGAGIVNAVIPTEIFPVVASSIPEIITTPVAGSVGGRFSVNVLPKIKELVGGADSLLIGCGMGRDKELTDFIEATLKIAKCPVVIDADGINNLYSNIDIIKQYVGKKVITPHAMEAARLLGISVEEVQSYRLLSATKLASLTKAVVVLKGPNTLIATPEGEVRVVTFGNSGMATAGTGDMLAGMITAFLAQGLNELDAAVVGTALHALSGDMAAEEMSRLAMTPTDMIDMLPKLFKKLGF